MAKRSDKLVHLTVTAFAWTMTLLSGVVIVDTDNPSMAHWATERLHTMHAPHVYRSTGIVPQPRDTGNADLLVMPSTKKSLPSMDSTTLQVHNSPSLDASGSVPPIGGSLSPSGGPQFSTAAVHLNILPAGRDTSQSTISSVRKMISRYNLVGWVSADLKMGTNEPVTLYLAHNASDYAQALSKVGLSNKQASSLSTDTGGFTLGNTMIIAMFQNQTPGDLANTIAHELTHVIFNDNVGQLPSWVNEGLAVSQGMYAQARVQGWIGYSGYARQMAETVIDAARIRMLVPLAVDEATVLQNNQTYDVELQDWLSVQYLMQRFGYNDIIAYFQRIKLGEPYDLAFSRTFHLSFSDFNRTFTKVLVSGTKATDPGVNIGLSIPPSFQGNVRILQHGRRSWQVFSVSEGNSSFVHVLPSGDLSGVHVLKKVPDVSPLDAGTLYVNLKPSVPERRNGQTVTDCGFAINYTDGLYGYADTWITLANGQTVYNHSPSLFGVDLVRLSETGLNDPVIALLMAKSNS